MTKQTTTKSTLNVTNLRKAFKKAGVETFTSPHPSFKGFTAADHKSIDDLMTKLEEIGKSLDSK